MRQLIFTILILGTTLLATFPPVFLWANRIDPNLWGLPFAFLWQIALALLGALIFACWYLAEQRSGDLDITVNAEASDS